MKATKTQSPRVYFHSLKLKNIRCFGDREVTLRLSTGNQKPARWTVIIGENGVGKTTILQLLVLNEAVPLGEGSQRGPIPKYMIMTEVTDDIDNVLRIESKSGFISTDIYLGDPFKFNSKGKVVENCVVGIKRGTGIIRWESNELGLDMLVVGYGANRHMSQTSLIDIKKSPPSASLFKDDVNLINAEEWLLQLDYALKTAVQDDDKIVEEKIRKRQDKVVEILVKTLPDVKRIAQWVPNDKKLKTKLAFETEYGTVFLKDLSLGYRTIVAWIVDLAARMFERYPDSEDPLSEPAVVLVDEIDLHMHPKWQRQIMNYLSDRFPNTQFIVTAHSPLIVQSAKEDTNIVVLRREDDHVLIDNNPEIVRGWRVDQMLNSEMFGGVGSRSPEIEDLLQKRRGILVKKTLTEKDKKELRELEEKIDTLPFGETREEIQARELIRRAAKELERNNNTKNKKL